MLRLRKLAWRLLHLAAWFIVIAGGTLLFLEESGLITRLVRDRVAQELGELGDSLTIGSVELRWFEPGILFRDIAIASPLEEGAAAGPEVLHLDEVHLSLQIGFNLTQPLRRIKVSGGEIMLSDDLSRALEMAGGEATPEQSKVSSPLAWDRLLSPPPMVFTDIAVELVVPGKGGFELGRASLVADPLMGGGYQLLGRLEPSLAGAIDASASAVHIEGRLLPEGVTLKASVRDMAFESDHIRAGAAAMSLPFERCAGAVTMTSTMSLSDWRSAKPQLSGELRVSLRDGALVLDKERPAIEELGADLQARFEIAAGERLWRREAWSVRAHTDARWLGSPVEAWARFGQDVPGKDWVHAWARIPNLPLETNLPEVLSAPPEVVDLFIALEPEGQADITVDFRMPDPPPIVGGGKFQPRIAAHLALSESLTATYRGLIDPATERRVAFPLPVTNLAGYVLFGHDPLDRRSDHVQIDLRGKPGEGDLHLTSVLYSPIDPPPYYMGPELDMHIELTNLPLDENAALALSGSPGTRELWDTWSPLGGIADSHWRLFGSPNVGGMTAWGQVSVHDAALSWKELPVPIVGVRGELEFTWAAQPVPRSDDPRGLLLHRPMGVTYSLSNLDAQEIVGLRARANGAARQRSITDESVGIEVEKEPWIQVIDVELPALFLRGRDWDVLAERTPELAEVTSALGAKGSVAVRYLGVSHLGASEFISDVEAQPIAVEVSPEFFQRRTRDLSGRILVRSRSEVVKLDEPPGLTTTETRFNLTGKWAQGVELAASGILPAEGLAHIYMQGAGIDPSNNAFRGALLRSLSDGESGSISEVDFSNRNVTGHLDLAVESTFLVGTEDEPINAYRIFLRGNTLETESLTLGGLSGVLEQREDVLSSQFLRADLRGHPLELRDVLIMPLGRAADIPEADPLFSEPGTWEDPLGLGMQARLTTRDLPLDVEHLSALLSPEALLPLEQSSTWSGKVDVLDARILITGEDDGDGLVAVKGKFRPHDITTRLGVPIRVNSADLELGEMILENGRVRGWGTIDGLNAELAGRQLTDASMVLGYVDGRLTIDNLSGDFEGGELVARGVEAAGSRKALGIDLSPPYRFDLALSLDHVELDRLLRGVFPSSIADKGTVDLELSLSGTPGNVADMTGGGWVELDEGRLWSIPVARELFYQLGIPDSAIFDGMSARFQLRDGVLEGSYLEMNSSLINLVGEGWLDLDGRLAMDLEVRYSILDKLGSLSRILYWLNDNLWRVAVRGDLTRPRVSIRNVILELFGGFEDTPRRELPLPGISELGPHF